VARTVKRVVHTLAVPALLGLAACSELGSLSSGIYAPSDPDFDDGCNVLGGAWAPTEIQVEVTATEVIIDQMRAFPRTETGFGIEDHQELMPPGFDCRLDFRVKWAGHILDTDVFEMTSRFEYAAISGAQCNQVLGAPLPCVSWTYVIYTQTSPPGVLTP